MKVEWVQPIYLYDTQQNGYSVPVVRVSELVETLKALRADADNGHCDLAAFGFRGAIDAILHTLTDASQKEGT